MQNNASQGKHEEKDASVGWIFAIVGMIAFSGIVIHVLLGDYLGHLNREPAPVDGWQPISRPPGGLVAPNAAFPRLQVAPPFDLATFRRNEETLLNSYGPASESPGKAHIPISVAMDLLLKKGVPVRNGTNAQTGKPGPSTYEMQLERVRQLNPGKQGDK